MGRNEQELDEEKEDEATAAQGETIKRVEKATRGARSRARSVPTEYGAMESRSVGGCP